MEIKEFKLGDKSYPFIRFKKQWVLPLFQTYSHGLGSPIAMFLYTLDDGSLEYYGDITVNLPECKRSSGCQFIDTNNNGTEILDWLEQNDFGKRTGNQDVSGFCSYPEFNFYKGDNFWKYKKISDEINETN